MKNEQQPVVKSGTAVSRRSKKMGLSSKNLGHIMSILTNMYADSYEATLREYAANAYDSHIAAGQDRPIEITLPTYLSPSLLIQDFGVGMGVDTVVDVYAEYAESTKNESDDEVGGFGIGAKSAFTLGSQFIVTAVKDGQKTVALFSMGEDGVPGVDIVGEAETDEPNGVLVSLAVEDIDRMRETAVRVFSTWDPARVLVDGEHPSSIFERAFYVNAQTALVKDHDGGVYVTLGPVAYPVSSDQLRQVAKVLGEHPAAEVAQVLQRWDSSDGTSLFFRGNVGDMTIAPNREMLRDTRKTINSLAAMVTRLSDDLTGSVQTRLDASRSRYQAAMEFRRATTDIAPLKVSRKAVSFDGLQGFKSEVQVNLTKYSMGSKGWTTRGGYSNVMVVREHAEMTVDAQHADKILVVTEVKDNERGAVKRYVKRFLENNEDIEHIMVTPATGASFDWFQFGEGVENGARTMTLTEWRANMKTLRANYERTHNEPSYTTGVGAKAQRDLDDRDLLSDILSWGKDLIVVTDKAPGGPLAEEALADYTVVVLLGTQSEAALTKRVEADGAVEIVGDYVFANRLIKELAEEKYAAISDDEKAALGAISWLSENSHEVRSWANFYQRYSVAVEVDEDGDLIEVDDDEVKPEPTNRITHPVFAEVLEARDLAEMVAADITDARRKELNTLASWIGKDVETQAFDFEVPSFSTTFPLLNSVSYYSWREEQFVEDALAYVNNKA